MKKKIVSIIMMGTLISFLTGCHQHEYSEATCIEPKTCVECGKTEGDTVEHTFAEATCTEAKTCSVCGATEGEPKGHVFTEATCTEAKTCSVCGATEGEPNGHDWKEATYTTPKTCNVCGTTEGDVLRTEVEETYNTITTLKRTDCKKNSLGLYSYNGVTFTTEDSEWLDSPINKDGSINAISFYNKMAKCLVGFELGNSWKDYAPQILGYVPKSRAEFAEKVKDLSTYIVEDKAGNAIVDRLEKLKSVNISFDDGCIVSIDDVTVCSEELGISEVMLGYILGALHDYGAEISFSGAETEISYPFYEEKKEIEPISEKDFIVECPNENSISNVYEELIQMRDEYYDAYTWFCYIPGVDISREGTIKTARGIRLGDTVEAVTEAYGDNKLKKISSWDEYDTYQAIQLDYPENVGVLVEQCSSILTYRAMDNGRVEFYFDDDDELSWVVFWMEY